MPYFVTDQGELDGCAGYATVKDDGEILGCHDTKQAAIDQMLALSIAEDIEPGGERVAHAADTRDAHAGSGLTVLDPRQFMIDVDERQESEPAPPEDQIEGSDENEPGSASDKTGDIALNDATETALQRKADEHNEQMRKDDRPNWTRVRVSTLRSVYRRGAGAYSTSHRPGVSRAAWSMARVNAFLYLSRRGRPENPNYTGDNDLLHSDHPRYSGSRDVDGSVTSRDLPDNYRPALEADVPEGRACGNCFFYDESMIQDDMALCRRWEEYVRGDHYCNAWRSREDEDRAENIPQYIRRAAARGLELNREGFGGDGLTEGTLRDARAMARGEMSDDKVVRANSWAARHAVDLDAEQNSNPDADGWPGPGAVAHYLWGIDPLDPEPARRWLEREVARIRGERMMMDNVEIRTFDASICEMRAAEDGDGMTFGGYAWRYNAPSLPLPFTERIAPGAFTRTLKSKNDIRAYVNHDDTRLLGSTRAKTLRIEDRADGGYVEIDLPNTTDGRDIRELVARGDIQGMSFGFSTVRDSWSDDGAERTLDEVRLHEVSVVTAVPAYPQTTASVRNLRVIAKRTATDIDQLADAISALEAGDISDDQADILRKVVDRASGIIADPEEEAASSAPISLLMKQLDLLGKTL